MWPQATWLRSLALPMLSAHVGMQFGILSFPQGPFDRLAEEWRMVEAGGFDSAYVPDTLAKPGVVDYEAWTVLAALARETSRMRIGTLVTILPFRHPALLAAQAIGVDRLSGGRLELGIGTGDDPADWRAIGMEPWSPRERVERFEEQVLMLDQCLRGGPISYAGRFYRIDDVIFAEPVSRPRPSLIVAAQGPRGIRLAGRFADRWSSLGGQPPGPADSLPWPEAARRTQAQGVLLDEACAAAGRDPRAVKRSVLTYRTGRDPLSSLDAFDEYVGLYRDAGIGECIFYWPPLASVRGGEPVSNAERATFDRITKERIATRAFS